MLYLNAPETLLMGIINEADLMGLLKLKNRGSIRDLRKRKGELLMASSEEI